MPLPDILNVDLKVHGSNISQTHYFDINVEISRSHVGNHIPEFELI